MTKLDYGDFYKFLVSLGTVLISLSLLVPWLFLRESFDVDLKDSEISELPTTAQTLIRYRQYTALWFILNVWWISGSLAIGGLALLVVGTFLWARRQHQIVDKKEGLETQKVGLETEKLRRELEPLSPAEIAEKGLREVKGEIEEETPESAVLTPLDTQLQNVQKYLHIEEVFLDKLIACYGRERVIAQQHLKRESYDAILLSDSSDLADVVFEVKYLTRPMSPGRLRETVRKTIVQTQNYGVIFGRLAIAIMLFVLKEGEQHSAMIERYVWEMKDQTTQYGTQAHGIFITEEELIRMRCPELRSRISALASQHEFL